MKRLGRLWVIVLLVITAAAASLPSSKTLADAEFFDGKTITYIVATKPGGGYDTYARLIAKYLEKHLPGARVIVKNVPGAGHIIGTNHLYEAKPDGLTIGSFNTGLIYAQLLKREGVKFDLREMSWIGKAASDPRVLTVGVETGIASLQDLRGAEEPVLLSSSGIGTASNNEMTLLAHALDLNVKIIPGYGGNEGEMGIMRGEIAGMLGSYSSLRPFVENGFGTMILRVGGDADTIASIPAARDLVHDSDGRAIAALIESQIELGRLTAGPPDIPPDRLELLRGAYEKALADPDLRRQATRLGIPIVPLYGEAVAAKVETALNQSPATLELLASVMNADAATRSVKADLLGVAAKGKRISFRARGETVDSKVSGSRTRVIIAGQVDDRANLKEGMTCTIEFLPGGDNEARLIDCGD
jgi:tripartite-type tricarboxylate transporter receptor subunit TctC